MKILKLLYLFIFTIVFNHLHAQVHYTEMNEESLILLKWKTYDIVPYNDDITKLWLNIFDKKNYGSYINNEFKLRDKIEQTNANLYSRIETIENSSIWTAFSNKQFGDYNFATETFTFLPFKNSSFKISTPTRYSYFYDLERYKELFNAEIIINDLSYVDGIAMNKNQAEQFLIKKTKNNLWGENSIDRKVFLKIYYSYNINDKFEINSKEYTNKSIKAKSLIVQAFSDKEYNHFLDEWMNPSISELDKKYLFQVGLPLSSKYGTIEDIVDKNSDKDGDGVPDVDDKCPDVAGIKINKGCPNVNEGIKKRLSFSVKNIQFDSGKDKIRPNSFKVLDEVVEVLKEYPYYNINIDGHTDNIESYNADVAQLLSQDRSINAMNYLINKGVSPERLTAFGHGASIPMGDNNTPEGRSVNRRVEFNLIFK